MTDDMRNLIGAVLRKRAENGGRHLHHRDCIHNLPPAEQVAMRGRTVDWWTKVIGPLPEQITPDQWETNPPQAQGDPR
jgi:hypothetical protein